MLSQRIKERVKVYSCVSVITVTLHFILKATSVMLMCQTFLIVLNVRIQTQPVTYTTKRMLASICSDNTKKTPLDSHDTASKLFLQHEKLTFQSQSDDTALQGSSNTHTYRYHPQTSWQVSTERLWGGKKSSKYAFMWAETHSGMKWEKSFFYSQS